MAKILIVDDDISVVNSTADILKTYSFETISATDSRRVITLQSTRIRMLSSSTG